MIIYDIIPDKSIEAEAQTTDPPLDPPPTYSPSQQPQPPPPTSPSPEPLPVVHTTAKANKASNYVCVTRQYDSIKGSYTIDPTMSIPSSVLPLLAPGESEKERKNLKLESQHGSIDVELFLTGGKLGDKSKTTLDMRTTHGRITVKLNASAAPRAPLCLTAYSAHNSLNVYLPRSYEGLLKTTTNHGHVIFSAQLAEHITTFSEIDSIKHCFVGDFSEWKDGQEGWNGDEVILGSKHGKIKVWYADEGESLPTKGRNFLSRVLGLSA